MNDIKKINTKIKIKTIYQKKRDNRQGVTFSAS